MGVGMSGGKHTAGPWKVARNGLNTRVYEDGGQMICVVSSKLSPAPNARLIAAAPDLLDCAKLAEQTVHRSKSISAPEDVEIERLCERLGYGAVMDAAARLWVRKDPIGALTVGPCVATVQSAIAKAEGCAP